MAKTQAPFPLVLAADGRKMSKRLKNYPDPAHILDTYGADALRLYMINSPIVRAEDLCFTEEGVVPADPLPQPMPFLFSSRGRWRRSTGCSGGWPRVSRGMAGPRRG